MSMKKTVWIQNGTLQYVRRPVLKRTVLVGLLHRGHGDIPDIKLGVQFLVH